MIIDPFEGAAIEYHDKEQTHLLDRWQVVHEWFEARALKKLDPYCRQTIARISPTTTALDRWGRTVAGANFASQDYLSLASHPEVIEAACRTARDLGVHSAGSATLMGGTALAHELERQIAAFLGMKDCTLFSIGWAAGYGIVKFLVTPQDHVVIDILAHACLQEGAKASGAKVHLSPHNSVEAIERRLKRIRRNAPAAGILVVTESLFSMDSDTPDIVAIQNLCHAYNATLLVDVAHDLGAMGTTGRGALEMQAMLGKVDVVMGSFSKTFASNGGFVATNRPALKVALRFCCGPLTFTNALSPIQAAIVLKALDIVRSDEGDRRRKRLLRNATDLRDALAAEGFEILGAPSAIVPVVLGSSAVSRRITGLTLERGALVNLVEYPAVSLNSSRWRLQVMADHQPEHIEALVKAACVARDIAASEDTGEDKGLDLTSPERSDLSAVLND
jgi:7-keto-8-aminopelargonate synthetase-like enzyme